MRRALIVAGLVAAVMSAGAPARAAENGEWALHPSSRAGADERTFFSYEVRPGQRLEDSVTLINDSDAPITVELAPVDAYNTTDDGAFALRLPDDGPSQDVGAWVRLPVDRWTLGPGSSADFEFALVVPEDARPGDHVGGILSLATAASAADEAGGVSVRKGVGVRIYARVLGEMAPGIVVDEIRTSHGTPWAPLTTADATVSFRITNSGDVLAAPEIRLEATGPFGQLSSTDLGPTQELLPGNSVVLTHRWSGVPAGGPVTQRVIATGEGYEVTAASTFWVVPWWLVPVLVGIVVVALFLRRRLPRRATMAIAGAMLLVALAAIPARAADGPQLTLASDTTAVGETVRVGGRGWEPRTNVVLEVCGNLAMEGSVDCDIRGSRVVSVGPDGRFAARLAVGKLPAPCPCVVRARAITGGARVVASIDIAGTDSAPVQPAPPLPAPTPPATPAVAPAPDRSSGSGRTVALGIAAGSATAGIVVARYLGRRRRTPHPPAGASARQPADVPLAKRRWVCAETLPTRQRPRKGGADRVSSSEPTEKGNPEHSKQSPRWHRA